MAWTRDKAVKYAREYYAANRQRLLAQNAEYRAANKARIAERDRAYRNCRSGKLAATVRPDISEKVCAKCKALRSITTFSRNSSNSDGFQNVCKCCTREYKKRHYATHKRRLLEEQKAYRSANKEKVSAQHRAWWTRNREKALSAKRLHYKANAENIRKKNEAYYTAHKAHLDAARVEWRKRHPDRVSMYREKWAELNHTHIITKSRTYTKMLPDSYVKRLIVRRMGVKACSIPRDFVEAKRLHVKVTRLIKESRK